ncbi:uncharacterized protein LOC132095926 [Carassius carassius]|uniref:uncharacterized protein LOC132095926 n=1 Tax=Carassius carassius TaxID=217509 RepID=UPI0028688676|nr:uncharacterized protein LOC132095926 [Carassius carassius]
MHEKDIFVLPLLWWGLHVKMSCSSLISAKSEPTVSCYTNGMIVRLHGKVSENMKIKVMNEWQPLLKGSARCGYSLVSHSKGVVINAPFMPCTEPKDGMFTLSMAVEREFNLSCPELSLSLPIDTTNFVHENERISIPHAFTSALPPVTTTKTTPTPLLPYYIHGQPDFKPVLPRYPFLIFPPNIPPMILPQGPKIVGPPTAISHRPQAPVDTKHPQVPYWTHHSQMRPSEPHALPKPEPEPLTPAPKIYRIFRKV